MTNVARVHGERDLARTARLLAAKLDRCAKAEQDAHDEGRDALRRLTEIQRGLTERFGGLTIPGNAHLLDVLALIDVERTGRQPREWIWHWRGNLGTKGVPVVRLTIHDGVPGSDATAPRWLAVAFGLIRADDHRSLRRSESRPRDDVNPWMRYLGDERLIDYGRTLKDRHRT